MNPDLPFGSNAVMYTQKYDDSYSKKGTSKRITIADIHDVLPNGNMYSSAIILLKDEIRNVDGINKLKLTRQNPITKRPDNFRFIPLTDELQTIIKNHLVDAIIYSRKAPLNKCSFFKTLISSRSSTRGLKIGTEFDVKGHEDITINRCPSPNTVEQEEKLMMLTEFKLGKPTPHEINDCSGPHYLLEEHITDILENQFSSAEHKTKNKGIPDACIDSTNVHNIENLQEEDVVND